jgi:hypothetical protein
MRRAPPVAVWERVDGGQAMADSNSEFVTAGSDSTASAM